MSGSINPTTSDAPRTKSEKNENVIGAKKVCPAKKKSNKHKAKKCNYQNLKIQSGDREYSSEKNKQNRFEVVCGNETTFKTVNCSLENTEGPPGSSDNFCMHDGKVFDIDFDYDTVSNSQLTFKAQTEFDTSLTGMMSNFKSICWPPSAEASYYEINSNTCGNSNSVQLVAFPDLETTLSLKIQNQIAESKDAGIVIVLFGKGSEGSDDFMENLFSGSIRKYFHGQFESKYDGKTFINLDLSRKNDEKNFSQLPSVQTLKLLYRAITEFKDVVSSVLLQGTGLVTFSFCPMVSLSCKMRENVGDTSVDYQAALTFGFKPLVKLDGSFDFIGTVVTKLPGIGLAIGAMQWLLKKCEAGEVSLKISLMGSVSFTGSISKTGKDWLGDINPEGEIGVRSIFLAKYNISISYFFGSISHSGSAQGVGHGSLKAEPIEDREKRYKIDQDGISVFMNLKFTGVYCYWITGFTAGTVKSTVGGIPGYQGEVTTEQDYEETGEVPDKLKKFPLKKYRIFDERILWQGYINIVSAN